MTDDEQRDAIDPFHRRGRPMGRNQRVAGPHRDAGHEVLRAAGTIAL